MIDDKDYLVLAALEPAGIDKHIDILSAFPELAEADQAKRLIVKFEIRKRLKRLQDLELLHFAGDFTDNDLWVRGEQKVGAAISEKGMVAVHTEQLRRSQVQANAASVISGQKQAKSMHRQTIIAGVALVVSAISLVCSICALSKHSTDDRQLGQSSSVHSQTVDIGDTLKPRSNMQSNSDTSASVRK